MGLQRQEMSKIILPGHWKWSHKPRQDPWNNPFHLSLGWMRRTTFQVPTLVYFFLSVPFLLDNIMSLCGLRPTTTVSV